MEPGLNDAERALVHTAAGFAARVIAPQAAEWDRAGAPLPRAVAQAWADLGLNALQITPGRGGHGASYFTKIAVAEAIARCDMASAFALNLIQGSVTRMEREGSPAQIARYLPDLMSGALICSPSLSESGAGSDFAAIATLATENRRAAGRSPAKRPGSASAPSPICW